MKGLSGGMDHFQSLFEEQRFAVGEALQSSGKIRHRSSEIGRVIAERAVVYENIHRQVSAASEGADRAARSARVLSQLGTYLRMGGRELSHVIDRITVSEERFLNQLSRKEARTALLYNLEVFQGESLLGHLGDISPSGLMIYSEEELLLGQEMAGQIRLPLSYGDLPSVEISFIPRRNEKALWFYKVGCSFTSEAQKRAAEGIEFIIENYTVTPGATRDTLAKDSLNVGKGGPPLAPKVFDGAENELIADLEEVEELEEI